MIGSKQRVQGPMDKEERSSWIWFWSVMVVLVFVCGCGITAAVVGLPSTGSATDDEAVETLEVGEDGQVISTNDDGITVEATPAEGEAADETAEDAAVAGDEATDEAASDEASQAEGGETAEEAAPTEAAQR